MHSGLALLHITLHFAAQLYTTVKCYIATKTPPALKPASLQALPTPKSPHTRYVLTLLIPLPRQKPMKLEEQIVNDPCLAELLHTQPC